MSEEQAFLDEIREDSDNDLPRLIFADWLEERGDPRGEFIRTQCELAVLQASGDPRANATAALALKKRERALLAEHDEAWLSPLRALGARDITFRRGFVEELKIDAETFVAAADELSLAAPLVSSLNLRMVAPWARELAGIAALARITSLSLRVNRITAQECIAFHDSPHLRNLRRLDLSGNRIGPEGAAAIAAPGRLPRLESLDLWANHIGDDGAMIIAQSDLASSLTDLELGLNDITDKGVARLLKVQAFNSLKRFGLTANRIQRRQKALQNRYGADVCNQLPPFIE